MGQSAPPGVCLIRLQVLGSSSAKPVVAPESGGCPLKVPLQPDLCLNPSFVEIRELPQEDLNAQWLLCTKDVGQHHRREKVAHCVVRLTCNVGHTAVTPLGKETRTKSESPLAAAGEHTALVICQAQFINLLRRQVVCSVFYFLNIKYQFTDKILREL